MRYLEPSFKGETNLNLLPYDALARRSRYSLRADHEGALPYGAYAQLRAGRAPACVLGHLRRFGEASVI